MSKKEENPENPVESYLHMSKAAAAKARAQELVHLNQFQQTQSPEALQPLLKAYEPVIESALRHYRAPNVPAEAMRAELTGLAVKAFKTYDPDRGAQLQTHVQNMLRKGHRYNGKYQNAAYIPPGQAKYIGDIDRAHVELSDQFGRAPTSAEIGKHIGISATLVNRVQGARRADISTSSFEEDPFERQSDRDQEILSLLPYSLTNERDKEVFHYMYGDKRDQAPRSGGKVNMGQLAKQLGLSSSQLSRSHTAITNKFKEYK